jgi:hypothetical protein
MNSWPILTLLICLIFLVLLVADWELNEHLDNLSRMKLPPAASLQYDPHVD